MMKLPNGFTYVYNPVQEEEQTGCVCILPGDSHEVEIVVLDVHVGHPVIKDNGII